MNDRTLDITLILFFGLSGLLLLVGAWTIPSLQADKITAGIAGGVGIGFAIIRGIMLRRATSSTHDETAPVRVPSDHYEHQG